MLPACAGGAAGEFVEGGEKGGAEVAQVCEKGVADKRRRHGGSEGADTEDAKSRRWIDEVGTREGAFSRETKKEEEMGHRTDQQQADAGKAERRGIEQRGRGSEEEVKGEGGERRERESFKNFKMRT